MVFFLVGLGLGNERDITVKGLEIVKRCSRVYLEAYTAVLAVPAERLVRAILNGQLIVLHMHIRPRCMRSMMAVMAGCVLRARGDCGGP